MIRFGFDPALGISTLTKIQLHSRPLVNPNLPVRLGFNNQKSSRPKILSLHHHHLFAFYPLFPVHFLNLLFHDANGLVEPVRVGARALDLHGRLNALGKESAKPLALMYVAGVGLAHGKPRMASEDGKGSVMVEGDGHSITDENVGEDENNSASH